MGRSACRTSGGRADALMRRLQMHDQPDWDMQGPMDEVDTKRAVSFEVEALPGSVVLIITAEDENTRMVLDVPVKEAAQIAEMLTRAVSLAGGPQ